MSTVRLGIIGLGNIGQHHAAYLSAGKVAGAELVAVSDPVAAKLGKYPGLKTFERGEDLVGSGAVDAVIIATPHFQHATLGIEALEQGLHLMVEKPISAHKADAEHLISAHHRHPALIFSGMFQLRVEPRYRKLRELLAGGELGQVVRVGWIMTDWFRTEAYYGSGGWRATWKGEGGGVLLNQCLHNLDTLQWLLGMPVRVRGFCQLGRFHNIEVEDSVSAYFEYANRATGTFVSSTGEAPGTNRLEIAGTRGRVVLEEGRLRFTRNTTDMMEFSRSSRLAFAKPDVWQIEIPFEDAANSHATLVQNFVNAILHQEPLIAPGEEGLASVEFANAILYSSLTDSTISLPLDGAAYETRLSRLIRESRIEKETVETSNEDFAASFRK